MEGSTEKGLQHRERYQDFCGRIEDYIPFAVQFSSLVQAANKPQDSKRKSKHTGSETELSTFTSEEIQPSCGIKISSPSYSASSSLQWGSRVWLPAIQPEKGFSIAQRWLRAICMHNSTLTSSGICLFLPPINLTSRDANVKAIPVPMRLQPRNQTGTISLSWRPENCYGLIRRIHFLPWKHTDLV